MVADPYALAVLRQTADELLQDGKMSRLATFTTRLFIEEMERTAERTNYERRFAFVARGLEAVEAGR
ncbi:hypothetical protein NA8A_05603 [Nitratireductor indicus C115]|uniref:Uncharacterized protein n=1 Tax=Nitratireductor indicus C115 TaxID=1231190 RepID=K2PR23_9HYPH|nr:hypothetical protein [Nitratireductor indicus]EKF43482.1 hypothetical protein NA8A_05603 [Nitratireductor indicus C115]SFQ06671.1 hypothetical protein SAMN05216176_101185 [Nitratireductor indicus]